MDEESRKRNLEACKRWYWKNKEFKNKKCKEWYSNNVEMRSEYNKLWREKNKEYDRERRKDYMNTPMGRASHLVGLYNNEDRKHNRGKGNLTPQWVLENILIKPCAHCGKEGWEIIGCNRLDNSKPHTMDNVEPCCKSCNTNEYVKTIRKLVDQISPVDGEVIKTWESATEAGECGFSRSTVSACCRGERKIHKGYLWKYLII